MTVTLCTSGAVVLKAGKDATILADADYTTLINQAEGDLAADTRVDWVAVYSGISANYKQVIEGACAAKAAVSVIAYDPYALGSLTVATTKVNICLDEYDRAVSKLKDANIFKPFGGTALTE